MKSREGREPVNQAARLQDCLMEEGAAKSLCRQLAAPGTVAWGCPRSCSLLAGRRPAEGSPGEVMQSALSKIRT